MPTRESPTDERELVMWRRTADRGFRQALIPFADYRCLAWAVLETAAERRRNSGRTKRPFCTSVDCKVGSIANLLHYSSVPVTLTIDRDGYDESREVAGDRY
jgi:hypothetical protein